VYIINGTFSYHEYGEDIANTNEEVKIKRRTQNTKILFIIVAIG
jgi:hypothetical protein